MQNVIFFLLPVSSRSAGMGANPENANCYFSPPAGAWCKNDESRDEDLKMKLDVLIATIDEGIYRAEDVLLEPLEAVRYIVSHQVTGKDHRVEPQKLRRSDVLLSRIEGRGLAANRNNALALSSADIALLADDDVRYRPEYFQGLCEVFVKDQALDVACLKIATPAGEKPYKDYSPSEYLLNENTGHYISSLEVAFRPAVVRGKNIFFDERFGLGSGVIGYGEEAVFIHDCLRAGLRVKFVPRFVVEHPRQSAVKSMDEYARARIFFKGGYDARRYGWLALPAAFYDTLRLQSSLRARDVSPSGYLRERLQGALSILKKQQRRGFDGLIIY